MDPTGGVTVTSDDAGRVVIELSDTAYPDRVIKCRLSPQQARELSAVLALKAHSINLT